MLYYVILYYYVNIAFSFWFCLILTLSDFESYLLYCLGDRGGYSNKTSTNDSSSKLALRDKLKAIKSINILIIQLLQQYGLQLSEMALEGGNGSRSNNSNYCRCITDSTLLPKNRQAIHFSKLVAVYSRILHRLQLHRNPSLVASSTTNHSDNGISNSSSSSSSSSSGTGEGLKRSVSSSLLGKIQQRKFQTIIAAATEFSHHKPGVVLSVDPEVSIYFVACTTNSCQHLTYIHIHLGIFCRCR